MTDNNKNKPNNSPDEKKNYVGRYEKSSSSPELSTKSNYVGRYEKRDDNMPVEDELPQLKPLKPLRKGNAAAPQSAQKRPQPVSHAEPETEKSSVKQPENDGNQRKKPLTAKQKKLIKKKKRTERRRRRITNAVAWVNIAAVGGLLAFGCVYMFAFEHETIANDENRYLAEFPEFSVESYFSGEYTEGVANYFDDTVPNRAAIKEFITKNIMPLKGTQYGDDGVELHGIAFENKPAATTAPSPVTTTGTGSAMDNVTTQTTTTLPSVDNPAADGEMANNILIANNRGITIYGGGWGTEKEYANTLNEFKKNLPDVEIYSLTAPTAGSFYIPENYKDLMASEKDDFDSIKKELKNVKQVDAYTALLVHKNEDIYSRTDHHWQPLGAYYAAQAFAMEAGVEFPDIKSYQKVILHDYVGTLYGYTQSAALLNNPENFVYYMPKNHIKVTQYDTMFQNATETELFVDSANLDNSSYYLVFGMDDRIVHVQTDCKNGRNLVIFKDSYGNALLPVLTGSFENIYLCDIRYFDLNPVAFAKSVKCTDMLFAMCSFSAVGPNREYLSALLYK